MFTIVIPIKIDYVHISDSRMDKIRNKYTIGSLGVARIAGKMRENRLILYQDIDGQEGKVDKVGGIG